MHISSAPQNWLGQLLDLLETTQLASAGAHTRITVEKGKMCYRSNWALLEEEERKRDVLKINPLGYGPLTFEQLD